MTVNMVRHFFFNLNLLKSKKILKRCATLHIQKLTTIFLGAQARDLLSQMLVINPDKRYSADQALQHPYIKSFNNVNDFIDLPLPVYDTSIESQNKTFEEMKGMFLLFLHKKFSYFRPHF